jgi:hypothetical protein
MSLDLTRLKEPHQREALTKIAQYLLDMANQGDASDVEVTLEYIQDGYLDALGPEDFFGTEGWAHALGLED